MKRVLPILKQYPGGRLLDIGCGFSHSLWIPVEPYMGEVWGMDRKAPEMRQGRINIIRGELGGILPFEDAFFDVVTMLAVLEHLDQPLAVLREVERVLLPGGRLVLTVPSPAAKPVLEFLSFQLGIVSVEEIRDHKQYYGQRELRHLFGNLQKLHIEKSSSFQLGFNTACVARKAA